MYNMAGSERKISILNYELEIEIVFVRTYKYAKNNIYIFDSNLFLLYIFLNVYDTTSMIVIMMMLMKALFFCFEGMQLKYFVLFRVLRLMYGQR